jgi:hypothetical protein
MIYHRPSCGIFAHVLEILSVAMIRQGGGALAALARRKNVHGREPFEFPVIERRVF